MERYVILSLELHLFFARIMKEHALFLKAGFTPADRDFAKEAGVYKQEFEMLLRRAVLLSRGVVSRQVLASGELVTEFTADAEKQTQCFTGIQIDREITHMETLLRCGDSVRITPALCRQVKQLNQTALRLLRGLPEMDFSALQPGTVLACRYIIAAPLAKLYGFTVNEEILDELERLLRAYLHRYVEKKMKTLQILDVMK